MNEDRQNVELVEFWRTSLYDSPPPFVVISQSASAVWTGDAGFCSDGLGDPEVDATSGDPNHGPQMGSSAGTWYQIKVNPGESFQLSVSPDAYSYGAAPNGPMIAVAPSDRSVFSIFQPTMSKPDLAATAVATQSSPDPSMVQRPGGTGGTGSLYPTGRITSSVSFSVTVWTPVFAMTNVTYDNADLWHIQVGTPTTAILGWNDDPGAYHALLPHPYTVNYVWIIPGAPFASWGTGLREATFYPFDPPDAPQASFVWADGGYCSQGDSPVAPTVIAIINVNGADVGQGTYDSQLVHVWRPYVEPLSRNYNFAVPSYVGSLPIPILLVPTPIRYISTSGFPMCSEGPGSEPVGYLSVREA